MCGFEFARGDTLCSHGCPLGALCRMVRCPACEYEFNETREPGAGTSWSPLRRLWRRARRWWSERSPGTGRAGRRRSSGGDASAGSAVWARVRPAVEARPGERVEILCLGREEGSRARALAVFGLVPGARALVLQQRPATVLRVDETELALDREIARDILVRSPREEEREGPARGWSPDRDAGSPRPNEARAAR